MYQVVLIDDEPLIVEGLKKVVPWKDFDCEVAACAEDAAGGARIIREIRPDILFTDIRMPGDDGLTMLAGLRSEFPDMQVTVLSGYREFGYAQEAIRLGVSRFLVKPSRMDDICETLEAMTGKLGRTSASRAANVREDEKKVNQSRPEDLLSGRRFLIWRNTRQKSSACRKWQMPAMFRNGIYQSCSTVIRRKAFMTY